MLTQKNAFEMPFSFLWVPLEKSDKKLAQQDKKF